MKSFKLLIEETMKVRDLEELESAADLFQFGVEKGYYNKRQSDEFNEIYWKVKNRCLAYEISEDVKINVLDIINIISNAPVNIKNDKSELKSYVNGRVKALKGNMKGLK